MGFCGSLAHGCMFVCVCAYVRMCVAMRQSFANHREKRIEEREHGHAHIWMVSSSAIAPLDRPGLPHFITTCVSVP